MGGCIEIVSVCGVSRGGLRRTWYTFDGFRQVGIGALNITLVSEKDKHLATDPTDKPDSTSRQCRVVGDTYDVMDGEITP